MVSADTISTARRWSMLAIALSSTMFANVLLTGAAFLIPTMHQGRGMDLAQAGLFSAMPSIGMVFTLIAWGYVVDRLGERVVLAPGSALTAAAAFAPAAWGLVGEGQRGRRAAPAAAQTRAGAAGTTGQPVPRIVDVVAYPRGLGAARGAAGRGVDVHAGVADGRSRMVCRVGGSAGHRRAGSWCAGSGGRRPVVRPRRVAAASHPDDRGRGGDSDGCAGAHR